MSKIIIFLAIVALASVNAQNQWPLNMVDPGYNGFSMIFSRLLPPQDILNKIKASPNSDMHAVVVTQNSRGGETYTTIRKDDNGVKKEYTYTN